MDTYTCLLTPPQIEKLNQILKDERHMPPTENMFYRIRTENCTITAYKSGKVVFQGKDASIYAASYMEPDTSFVDHVGSDECGTGDYFGPVCVCACVVRKKDLTLLNRLDIKDSKQIDDSVIIKVAPLLMKHLDHSLLILENEKYNIVQQEYNLNKIKALLHNKSYLNLFKAYKDVPKMQIIDQFCEESTYYGYLKQEKEVVRTLRFETKAENKFLAVACASIIARYAFLQSMLKLEVRYGQLFQKGASAKTDMDAVKFAKKYGFDNLNKVAKLHFKNTQNVKQILAEEE